MPAPVSVPTIDSYELQAGIIVEIDEAIYMVSPEDSPVLTGAGSDGLSVIGSQATPQVKFEMQSDELLTPRSALAGQHIDTVQIVTVQAGHRARFSTGDILMLGKAVERVRVTGYSSTVTDGLTVTRSWGVADAATHASGAAVVALGTVLAEGSNPENTRARDRDLSYNITQIFGPTQVKITGTAGVVRRYGVPSEFNRQLMHRITEATIAREQAFLYGERVEDSGAALRETGGFLYFVTGNVDSTSTQLTVATVQTLQQDCYNRGKVPRILMANPVALADLNLVEDTNRVRQEATDPRRGRQPVMTVSTEFGVVTVARNRWLLANDALLWDRDNIKRRPLRPMQIVRLAKSGDADAVMFLVEEGFHFQGVQHLARFSALSYTGQDLTV